MDFKAVVDGDMLPRIHAEGEIAALELISKAVGAKMEEMVVVCGASGVGKSILHQIAEERHLHLIHTPEDTAFNGMIKSIAIEKDTIRTIIEFDTLEKDMAAMDIEGTGSHKTNFNNLIHDEYYTHIGHCGQIGEVPDSPHCDGYAPVPVWQQQNINGRRNKLTGRSKHSKVRRKSSKARKRK